MPDTYWGAKDGDAWLSSKELLHDGTYWSQWLGEKYAIAFVSRGAAQTWCNRLKRGAPAQLTDVCIDARWREDRRRRGVRSW